MFLNTVKPIGFGMQGSFWPYRNRVEVAVLDEGIGIRESLRRNPRLTLPNDLGSLKLAVTPGVSGAHFKGNRRLPGQDGPWANSGQGLYILSEMCRQSGHFSIASGTAALLRDAGNEIECTCHFAGTLVRLEIDLSNINRLGETIKEALDRGDAKKTGAQYSGSGSLRPGTGK